MIIKETYKPLDSKIDHFESSYQKFLKSKLRNEKAFISDFMKSLNFIDIEKIISKFHKDNSKKEKEFIEYVDSSSSFYHLVDYKLKPIENNYDKVSKELSYPSRIVYFVDQLYLFKELLNQKLYLKHTESFYKWVLHSLNQRIISNRNLLFNYIEGLINFDVKDAISAYMVLDRNKADRIFEKAMISNSPSLRLNFEIILENWTVKSGEELFVPNIYILKEYDIESNKVFMIEKIQLAYFRKQFISFKFPDRIFAQENRLNINGIKNESTFIKLLRDLFLIIDNSISEKDIDVFYYSLTQVAKRKFLNKTMIQSQNKINEVLSKNYISIEGDRKQSRLLLCAFLYFLKEYDFLNNVNNLNKALVEYFYPSVKLKKPTLEKYIYDDSFAPENFKNHYADLKSILMKHQFEPEKVLNRIKKNNKTRHISVYQ